MTKDRDQRFSVREKKSKRLGQETDFSIPYQKERKVASRLGKKKGPDIGEGTPHPSRKKIGPPEDRSLLPIY